MHHSSRPNCRPLSRPRSRPHDCRGFTLLEVLLIIAIIGILGAVALVSYQSYIARARAAEIALKFDAIRSNLSTATRAGISAEQCQQVAASVQPANLATPHAAMDVSFEAVPGGFAPVLRVCATEGVHGSSGVSVARETHTLLSRNVKVGAGAVIGDTLVSFALPLTDGVAACKTAATAAAKPLCAGGPAVAQPVAAQPSSVPATSVATSAPAVTQPPAAQQPPTAAAKPPAAAAKPPAAAAKPPVPVPTVVAVELMPKITGATALSAFPGAQNGVPIGTKLVALYLAGSDVNQLGSVAQGSLPTVTTDYTVVADAGYQYFDASGAFGRMMPNMAANLRPLSPSERNAWDGGIAIFSNGAVARMQKAANGNGNEKDYVYFSILSGVNARDGMAIVRGTAAPGQSVQVQSGGRVLATVRADAQGNWNFAGPAALAGQGQSINAVAAPARP